MEKKSLGKYKETRWIIQMKKQNRSLLLVTVLILFVILSFILYNEWPFLAGEKIVLAIEPVDPFDLLRGQYMTIRYDISTIDNIDGFRIGEDVFVSLTKDSHGIWRMDSFSRLKPNDKDFIKGKVVSVYGNSARIEYGIEQFFFERNANLPTINITAKVAVSSSGRAKLVQLLQNGVPIKIEYKKFDITS